MKTRFKILAITALMLIGTTSPAQVDDEGKIVVEITRDINGEKKTFKGEYNSTEEMRADPNYQEFAGDDNGFNIWFDNDENADVFMHLDQFKNHHGSSFGFFLDDDDDSDKNKFFFRHFGDDSTNNFFNLHLDNMDLEEYKEKLKDLGIEMEMLFDRLNDGEGERSVRVFAIKRVKITDVDNEFGKKGKVEESNILELDDLAFFPNPSSNGRFKVRFKLPEEGELSIKVSNLEGKEVFSRYFERFGGTYSEMIDLSGQKDGIYLLEIGQGKKRVTKKIVIN